MIVAEIGLLIYPDAQLAAVYGLTDLFRIAGDVTAASDDSDPAAIRVTHWRQADDGAGVASPMTATPARRTSPAT